MKKRLANDPGYFLNLLLSCVGLPRFFSLLDKKKVEKQCLTTTIALNFQKQFLKRHEVMEYMMMLWVEWELQSLSEKPFH